MSKSRSLPALVFGTAAALAALLPAQAQTPMQGTGKHAVPHEPATGQTGDKRTHAPHTLAGMDTDKDGRISRNEFKAAHEGKDAMFPTIDSDRDGFISQQEFDAHHATMGKDKHP